MKIRRRWFYGMASAAAVALVVTINAFASVDKANTAGAINQDLKGTKESLVVLGGSESNTAEKVDKGGTTEVSSVNEKAVSKPQVEVPVNLEVEKGDQKNADAGSSPWKLDPLFVSQVFVSLKISPDGIHGDYPIKYEELKLAKSTTEEAVVEVSQNKAHIGKVYLKRLVKQDKTGIWTVVGYDTVNNK